MERLLTEKYMGSSGEMMKAFNIKNGYGIHDKLLLNNIIPVIISGRQSLIVENRCRELGIQEVHQRIANKLEKLHEIAGRYDKTLQSDDYIGDDLNDLTFMESVKAAQGLIGCPADADKELIAFCDFVITKNCGEGAVRDFIDYLLGLSAV